MGILIDSPCLLDFSGEPARLQQAGLPEGEEFYLSILSADELLRCVAGVANPRLRRRRLAYVEAVLENFPILPIDRTTVRVHADIMSRLDPRRAGLGVHESWIAATCVAHGLHLLCEKAEPYKSVPGLEIWKRTP